ESRSIGPLRWAALGSFRASFSHSESSRSRPPRSRPSRPPFPASAGFRRSWDTPASLFTPQGKGCRFRTSAAVREMPDPRECLRGLPRTLDRVLSRRPFVEIVGDADELRSRYLLRDRVLHHIAEKVAGVAAVARIREGPAERRDDRRGPQVLL